MPAESAPVQVGDVLASKYRVEGVLGRGGMGVVVAATHLELEQRVALKFLLPASAAEPVLVERFVREARASVRLKSPHVARTLDTGRLADGCPFMVMEMLDGRDLDAEVAARGGKVAVEDVASWVLQACDALAEAHALGIIHRDLKPANMFLTKGHDGRDQVKILDFGISKSLIEVAGVSVTATDSVFGSPAYMSPEQMRSAKEVDARSDIWSMGVVLYELLTHRLPFDGTTPIAIGVSVMQDPPTPLSKHRSDLPAGFESVVTRCLEKDPARRYPDVAALAAALAPFAHARDRALAEHIVEIPRAIVARPSASPPLAPASSPALDKTVAAVAVGEPAPATPAKEKSSLPLLVTAAVVAAVLAVAALVAVLPRRPPEPAARTHVEPPPIAPPTPSLSASTPEPPVASTPVASTPASASSPPAAPSPVRARGGERRPAAPPATTTNAPAATAPTASASGGYYRVRE